MKIYVVRHGETAENKTGMLQGNMDTILDEKGVEQAKVAAQKLKGKGIDLIYSSPKSRTKKTAQIIADEIGDVPIKYDMRLKSRDHGEFQGMARKDINLPEYWNWNLDKRYQKAENVRDLYHRIDEFMTMLNHKYKDKTILIVTHSGVCRVLHFYFNGIPKDGDLLHPYEAINGLIEEYDMEDRNENISG